MRETNVEKRTNIPSNLRATSLPISLNKALD